MSKQGEARPSLTPSFIPASRSSSRVVTQVASPAPHLGWHSRGYLPHWDHPGMIQSLNFRLADAMPQAVLSRWRMELGLDASKSASRDAGAPSWAADAGIKFRRRVEEYLDAGSGECWLRCPEIAALVEGALLHFDLERYRLLAWCIMPNHVHVLIETLEGWRLSDVLHSWKSFTGSKANELLQRHGEFWQREYLDRFIRNAEHYEKVLNYIEENPVAAGLAKVKTDWQWSSARFRNSGSASIPAGGFPIQ
jgi:putative DNA methylase